MILVYFLVVTPSVLNVFSLLSLTGLELTLSLVPFVTRLHLCQVEELTLFLRNLYLVKKHGDMFDKINANPPLSCDSCGENPPIAYCTECNEIICQKCFSIHQILSITRNHVIHNFEEIKKMTQKEILKITPTCPRTCQDHIDHQLQFYCHQCNIHLLIEYNYK